MAIALVEQVTGVWDGGTTPKTLTLAATPPSGRLMVCRFASDSVPTTPSGWTRYGTYPDPSCADVGLFARLADGSINSVTLTSSGDTVGILSTYSGNISTSIADCKDQNAQAVQAKNSGTTGTTAQADEIALASIAAGCNSSGTWSAYTNSFTEDADLQSPGGAGTEVTCGFASKILSATGTQTTAATNAAPAGDCSGNIVTFKADAAGDQTLNVGFFDASEQLFAPTISNQSALTLDVGFHDATEQLFAPSLTANPLTLNVGFFDSVEQLFAPGFGVTANPAFISSTAQLFAPTLSKQSALSVSPGFITSTTQLFAPSINNGASIWDPIMLGVGSIIDKIMAGLVSQGLLEGTVADRERERLVNKLAEVLHVNKSELDLYRQADENNRVAGIGI